MKRLFYILFFISFFEFVEAQEKNKIKLENISDIEKDTVPVYGIPLKEVVVFQPLVFDNNEALRRYYILRYRTLKVYPFAKLAGKRLKTLNKRLEKIQKKSKRRKYMRRLEKFIYNEFEEELKKLSRSQGKILIKLIHRQTGSTAFELVKELRTGWKAFIYQTTASFFKLSLKVEYHPEEVYEDYLIEDILQRAFSTGVLEEEPTVLNYNLDDLYPIWKKRKNNGAVDKPQKIK